MMHLDDTLLLLESLALRNGKLASVCDDDCLLRSVAGCSWRVLDLLDDIPAFDDLAEDDVPKQKSSDVGMLASILTAHQAKW